MKKVFYYTVYDFDGTKVFSSRRKYEAELWMGGMRYMIRKDLSGQSKEKVFKSMG